MRAFTLTGTLASLTQRRQRVRRCQKVESAGFFYPPDYVIGKYDSDGDLDWDHGHYKHAPAGNKVGIIVHIIGIMYMLVGLNTVCDIYFCGALDEMVEKWNIKPDVAGATFMAAGGSAPELFTALIGTIGLDGSDVGFGCIVGSAVFNVLAVIGACGMAAKEPIKLTWWPLFRDCTFYIFGLCLLAIFAYGKVTKMDNGDLVGGGKIELWEAIVLFLAYLVYCTIMFFNEKLQAKVQGMYDKGKASVAQVQPVASEETSDKDSLKQAAEGEVAPGPPEHHMAVSGDGAKSEEKPVPATPKNTVVSQVPVDTSGNDHSNYGAHRQTQPGHTHHHHTDPNWVAGHHMRRMHHHAHAVHHHHHEARLRHYRPKHHAQLHRHQVPLLRRRLPRVHDLLPHLEPLPPHGGHPEAASAD